MSGTVITTPGQSSSPNPHPIPTQSSPKPHLILAQGHLILTSTFDDTSYVRQKLVYDLWRAMAESQDVQRLTPATFFAIMYLNGAYHGLYLACDRVDDEFIRHHDFPSVRFCATFRHFSAPLFGTFLRHLSALWTL